MCGLIGYSGPEDFDPVKINTLLYITSLERGRDATGIYSPLNGIRKNTDAGFDFAVSGQELIPDKTFIGHVRAKTVGANTAKNAHPFHRGRCILAHNGSLKNYIPLRTKYELPAADYDVDSDILCGAIAKANGIQPIREIDGSAVLMFNDTNEPHKIYIYRKDWKFKIDERPLFRGNIGPNVYFCSLDYGLKLIGCNNIKEMKPGMLYTIEEGNYVGKAKKIENTPYYPPSTFVNTNRNSSEASTQTRKMLGSNMRYKFTIKHTPREGLPYELKKDEYYQVVKVHNDREVDILEPITKQQIKVYINALDEWDIVDNKNYIIAINDVYDRQFPNAGIIFPKGTIVKADNSFMDGDVSVKTKKVDGNNWYYKKDFRKLTRDELHEHVNNMFKEEEEASTSANILQTACAMSDRSKNNEAKVIPFDIAKTLSQGNALIDAESGGNDIISDENQSVNSTIPDFKGDTTDSEIAVYDHFNTLNVELEKIKAMCQNQFVDNSIIFLIQDLIDSSVEEYCKIFKQVS